MDLQWFKDKNNPTWNILLWTLNFTTAIEMDSNPKSQKYMGEAPAIIQVLPSIC